MPGISDIGNIFGDFFGGLLYQLYNITGHSYGFALIIFTIIVKLILMPLNIKQIKSTMKMQELQPELKRLQDKYKDDREKLNEEMVKFFQVNNYNPANGCIMTFIQLPILLILWQVISKPISHMLAGKDYIASLFETLAVKDETSIFFSIAMDKVETLVAKGVPSELIEKIFNLKEGMHFLSIFNLSMVPTYDPSIIQTNVGLYLPLVIIPILAALFTYISSKMMMNAQTISTSTTSKNKKPEPMGGFDPIKTQKTMLLIGPVMTLVFAFQLPAGLSLYWLAGYVFQVFQQIYINKTIHGKKPEIDLKKKEVQDSK